MSVVTRTAVPEVIRSIAPLEAPDYTDAFRVSGPIARTPERWARATFEEAPAPLRWFLLAGWRVVLGLRLGPLGSPDHVLGWKVLDRAPSSTTLELRSWFLACHLVFWIDGTDLYFSSSVRYERRLGAVVWPPVGVIHRRAVPYLLRRAATR